MYYISLSSLLSEHRVLHFSLNYSWSTNYSKLSNILLYHFFTTFLPLFLIFKQNFSRYAKNLIFVYLSISLSLYIYISLYLSVYLIYPSINIHIYLSTFYLECWLVCDESIWIMSLIHQSLYKHVLGFQPNLSTWISVIRLKAKKTVLFSMTIQLFKTGLFSSFHL